MIKLIDTHAHLYAAQFDEDRAEMISRAKAVGVEKIYLPNVDQHSIGPMLALEAAYPGFCLPAMGLHPCSVKANVEEELALVEEWLGKRSFAAIGEIGIDLYWDKTYFPEQKMAFIRQLSWAKDLKLPVIIHARESLDILIDLVSEHQNGDLTGVFHCFTGSEAQATRIADNGFFIGLGGVLTFKKSGLDRVARTLPRDVVVLETDAPYLAPTPHRGKRNESAYVLKVAEKLAECWEVSTETVGSITASNASKLFSGGH